jgi:REP element-mobilizing transposase RayT
MARGDRREAIYRDDADRRMFLAALAEACGRTGWRCHAYVLMGNHYHLALETPEPNLVAGMAWLQTTYSRRHTLRHRLWGHLFGGRYKAALVDDAEESYFATLIDYVHLNPVRAGLVDLRRGLETFPWSSLGFYLQPATRRACWQEAGRGLACWQSADDARGRRQYLEHLEERVRAEGAEAGRGLPEGQSLQATLRRGWFFGSAAFREKLLALGGRMLEPKQHGKNYRAAAAVREHNEMRAEALVTGGMSVCGLNDRDLEALALGDARKAVIALAVKRETTVPLDWIARRLRMGARSTVSREVGAMARQLGANKELAALHRRITTASL